MRPALLISNQTNTLQIKKTISQYPSKLKKKTISPISKNYNTLQQFGVHPRTSRQIQNSRISQYS